MANNRVLLIVIMTLFQMLFLAELVCADPLNQSSVSGNNDQTDKPTMPNDDILELGTVSARTLLMQAQLALRSRKIDTAIELAKRGMLKDPEEIDLHKTCAEALEEKLALQGSKPDPAVFNECVQEWLMVLRNAVGDEKYMTFRGISIPGAEIAFADDDRAIMARYSLIKLAGRAPKMWESNTKYLKRVLKPVPFVEGTILKVSTRE